MEPSSDVKTLDMNGINKCAIMQGVLDRPSPASSVELMRHRARFALDRERQLLSGSEAQTLTECALIPDVLLNWEQWRTFVGRSAIQTMGLVDHQLRSYDHWLKYELTRLQRTMKSWTIAHGCRVHRFRIVKVYVVSPMMLADEHEEQYVNLSPHDARLSNSAYEGMLVVDVHQRTYCHPNGFLTNRSSTPATGAGAGAATTGSSRFQLPQGWEHWTLESEEIHLRKPFHRFGAMNMSMVDKRATGTLRPENFVYEETHDQGAWFACQNSAVFHPAHETLRHNHIFLFPTGGSKFVSANDGSETPDEKESFDVRQAKARVGAQIHMNKSHKLEIRCIHPTRRQRSTSTIVVRMTKYKRTDKFGGQNLTVQMQFLSVSLPPTVLFMALGFSIDQGIDMMRQVAGENHWYASAFDPILRKMRARHPHEVKTRSDACRYIADHADKESCSWDRKMLYANSFLENEFFPQIGLSLKYAPDKALFLAYVLWKLLDEIRRLWVLRQQRHVLCTTLQISPGILWSSLQRQISYRFTRPPIVPYVPCCNRNCHSIGVRSLASKKCRIKSPAACRKAAGRSIVTWWVPHERVPHWH